MDKLMALVERNARNQANVNPEKGIEVIGAGFSKSGTMSLYAALGILGYRTHHMVEVMPKAEDSKRWTEILKAKQQHKLGPVDWSNDVLKGYNAGVDAPFIDVYDDLAQAFPQAQVILSTRDPDSWFRSITETMMKPHWGSRVYWMAAWWDKALWAQINLAQVIIDGWALKFGGWGPHMMEARNREVKATIPAERLLEFRVQDGWEPLCKFLGKPIPDEPFPNVNDGPALRGVFRTIKIVGMAKWAAAVSAAGLLAYYGPTLASDLLKRIS